MFASFPLSLLDCSFLSSSAHLWVSLPVLSIPPQAVIANDIDMIAEGKGNDDLLVAYFLLTRQHILYMYLLKLGRIHRNRLFIQLKTSI